MNDEGIENSTSSWDSIHESYGAVIREDVMIGDERKVIRVDQELVRDDVLALLITNGDVAVQH